MRTWDWELEARAMASDGLETDEDGNVRTPLITYTRAVTAIRMTAAAYCLIHRQSPTRQEIAAYVDDNAKTAWLMENAARIKPADADERHAIKEIDAWYKQEWREEPNPRPAVSRRILYYERAEICRLIKRAADTAGESGYAPLEQLEHGSAERSRTARDLGIEDPGVDKAEERQAGFAAEFVEALENEAAGRSNGDATLKRIAWCARRALSRSRKKTRRPAAKPAGG